MDYTRVYNSLIARARNRSVNGYVEAHHVIPRCIGGTDHASNLVNLTAREHLVAHKLLVRIYPGERKLARAVWFMSRCKGVKIPSREFERYRRAHAELARDQRIGASASEETRQRMSESAQSRPPVSAETRKKSSDARKGRPKSETHRSKLAARNRARCLGQPRTQEVKDSISRRLSGRTLSPAHAEKLRGRAWFNNGVDQVLRKEPPGADWVPGRLR